VGTTCQREREGERAREQAARMGRDAGPRGRERTQAGAGALQLGRSAGPSRREKGEGGPKRKFLFFFF
jgi:hypothetical protein